MRSRSSSHPVFWCVSDMKSRAESVIKGAYLSGYFVIPVLCLVFFLSCGSGANAKNADGPPNIMSRIEILQKTVEARPNDVEAHIEYQDCRKYEDKAGLLLEYEKKIKENPDNAMYHYLYARIAKDRATAEAEYRKAIELDPGYSRAYISLGFIYKEHQKYREAEEALRRACGLDPGASQVFFLLGIVCEAQEKYDEARLSYEKTIELAPEDPAAYFRLAGIATQEGEIEKAETLYKKVIELDKDYAGAYLQLGILYDGHGKKEAAVAAFIEAVNAEPGDPDAYRWLGSAYEEQGDYEQAREQFNRALDINPDDSYCLERIAETYWKQERYEEELASREKLLQVKPEHEHSLYRNGWIYLYKLEDYDSAIESFRLALECRPRGMNFMALGTAYHTRYKNNFSLKDWHNALTNYKKAADSDYGRKAMLYHHMGILYNDRKYYVFAVKSWRKALEIDPDYSDASDSLYGGFITVFDFLDDGVGTFDRSLRYRTEIDAFDAVPTDQETRDAFEVLNNSEDSYRNYHAHNRFRVILEKDPDNVAALNGDAVALIGQYEGKRAVQLIERAIENEPLFAVSCLHLGNAYCQCKNSGKAFEAYRKAVELESEMSEAYSNLGVLFMENKDYRNAREMFARSLELDASNETASFNLSVIDDLRTYVVDYYIEDGKYYMENGNSKSAEDAFKRAIQNDSTYIPAYMELGDFYRRENRTDEAKAIYDKVLEFDSGHKGALSRIEILNGMGEDKDNP